MSSRSREGSRPPTWAVQPTPNPSASQGGQLNDVTCTSAGECMAVGTYGAANGSFTLAEFFNGSTWSIKATPGGGTDAGLSGVACASAASCIAVGFINSSPLIESYNGSVWLVQTGAIGSDGNPVRGLLRDNVQLLRDRRQRERRQ